MRRISMAAIAGLMAFSAHAQTVLIQDVRIFNGVDEKLTPGHVLVVDGLIEREGPSAARRST